MCIWNLASGCFDSNFINSTADKNFTVMNNIKSFIIYFQCILRMNFLNNNATFETTGEELLSHFGIADYSVFIFMLVVCSCIGLFFGYQDHRKNRKRLQQNDRANDDDQALEYLVGGRNMQVFPVAMSLIASGLSGVTLLGMPTETFVYGWTFWFVCIPIILVGILTHFVVIPVFYELKILSVFEVILILTYLMLN